LKTYTVFVFGLDRAGKTTLINIIKGGDYLAQIKPTIAFNVEKFIYENVHFQVWDAPGQKNLRDSWSKGYERANILMFVLDSSDKERFKEAQIEFSKVLSNPLTKGLPLLFCVHKVDINHSTVNFDEIKQQFIEPFIKERKILWVLSSIHDLNSIFNVLNSLLSIVLVRAKQAEIFLNIMSGLKHDINNQVTIMKNAIELLNDQPIDDRAKEYVNIIDGALDQTMSLLKNIKNEFEEKQTPPGLIDPLMILRNSIAFLSRGTNCQFEEDFEENLPKLAIDADKFAQIVNNLVINAIDAITIKKKDGIIKISIKSIKLTKNIKKSLSTDIRSCKDFKEGNYILMSIQDNGVGIPKAEQNNIFKMYYTTKSEGHGLGLATVYSIVTLNDGYITFESEEQKGTKFNVYLPVSS
jgi:small GTP-binding protein